MLRLSHLRDFDSPNFFSGVNTQDSQDLSGVCCNHITVSMQIPAAFFQSSITVLYFIAIDF